MAEKMFPGVDEQVNLLESKKKCYGRVRGPVVLDTFILGDQTVVDHETFKLWIQGNSAQEACTVLHHRGELPIEATPDFLLADVMDQYRTYGMLEKLLYNPKSLSEQWCFPIDLPTQKMLIEQYYDFDDLVMREILEKKLSSRHRKDLDKVNEATGVNIPSCRRQFDNAKRVFKSIKRKTGSMHQNIKSIKTKFFLSDDLAKKYCAIVFIARYHFETNKKLQYLSFNDLCQCAYAIMNQWTSPITDDSSSMDIEREFLVELREVKVLLDNEKAHKFALCQKLKGKVSEKIYTEVNHNFSVYSLTLINIAYSLHHNKSPKELFVDLVEKFIEPCKLLQWTVSEVKTFLDIYSETAAQLDDIKSEPDLCTVWKRYMNAVA